jgi:hypothetical protein
VPINKKHKLGPKIVDCVFLGYVHRSIAYRFLVIKLEVSVIYVNTFWVLVMLLSLRIFFL